MLNPIPVLTANSFLFLICNQYDILILLLLEETYSFVSIRLQV